MTTKPEIYRYDTHEGDARSDNGHACLGWWKAQYVFRPNVRNGFEYLIKQVSGAYWASREGHLGIHDWGNSYLLEAQTLEEAFAEVFNDESLEIDGANASSENVYECLSNAEWQVRGCPDIFEQCFNPREPLTPEQEELYLETARAALSKLHVSYLIKDGKFIFRRKNGEWR